MRKTFIFIFLSIAISINFNIFSKNKEQKKKAVTILSQNGIPPIYFRPLKYKTKRGDYATSYSNPSDEHFNWIKRFDIVEFGGIGDPGEIEKIEELKNSGVKHVLCYDWMPAVYYYLSGDNYDFVNWIYQNRYQTTLNPDGPFPHAEENGYEFVRDYYFDFVNNEVVERKVNFITSYSLLHKYNGLFFDWGPGVFIYEPEYSSMKDYFQRKHPSISYLKSVGFFYSRLKPACKNLGFITVTNQGYRNPENVLPYVNYDMAESYIVDFDYFGKKLNVKGYGLIEVPETKYFPVSQEGSETFLDTLYYLDYIKSLLDEYCSDDFKKFVFLNYAAPEFVYDENSKTYVPKKPKNAIYLSFATSHLINEICYLEVPFDNNLEEDRIYFVDLGNPLDENYEVNLDKKYAIRFYENGIVFVYFGNELSKDINISSDLIPENTNYCDVFSNRWGNTNRGNITIKINTNLDTLTGKTIPIGRVYMYEKGGSLKLLNFNIK